MENETEEQPMQENDIDDDSASSSRSNPTLRVSSQISVPSPVEPPATGAGRYESSGLKSHTVYDKETPHYGVIRPTSRIEKGWPKQQQQQQQQDTRKGQHYTQQKNVNTTSNDTDNINYAKDPRAIIKQKNRPLQAGTTTIPTDVSRNSSAFSVVEPQQYQSSSIDDSKTTQQKVHAMPTTRIKTFRNFGRKFPPQHDANVQSSLSSSTTPRKTTKMTHRSAKYTTANLPSTSDSNSEATIVAPQFRKQKQVDDTKGPLRQNRNKKRKGGYNTTEINADLVAGTQQMTTNYSTATDTATTFTPIQSSEQSWLHQPGAVNIVSGGEQMVRRKGALAQQPTRVSVNGIASRLRLQQLSRINNESLDTYHETDSDDNDSINKSENDLLEAQEPQLQKDEKEFTALSFRHTRFLSRFSPGILCCACVCVILVSTLILLFGFRIFANNGDDGRLSTIEDPTVNIIFFQSILQKEIYLELSSDSNVWEDIGSPQSQALNWLALQDMVSQAAMQQLSILQQQQQQFVEYKEGTSGSAKKAASGSENTVDPTELSQNITFQTNIIIQRYILSVWYFSLNGTTWVSSTNWLSTTLEECQWEFLSCDNENKKRDVTSIIVANFNNMQGTIPTTEVQYLTNLRHLSIQQNKISLPKHKDGSSLPKSLKILDFEDTEVHHWPVKLRELSHLRVLKLSNNGIEGSLTNDLRLLTKLESLSLDHNKLTGNLDTISHTLSLLKYLDLSANRLTGSIHDLYHNLSQLETLLLFDNLLSGPIPKSQLHHLSNSLRELDMGGNQFSKHIPTEIGLLTKLVRLELDSNPLTGSLPTELGLLSNLEIFTIGYNELTGTLPSNLGDMTDLVQLTINTNKGLVGSLPSSLGRLVNVTELTIAATSIENMIPSELGKLSTSLTLLRLDGNFLSGTIPKELAKLSMIEVLKLSENADLTGELPNGICNLPNLEKIHIPEEIQCTCPDHCK